MRDYQVAIVGGGPAGLAAALTLSRSMIRTVVLDAPASARNAASPHIGALPGHDLIKPAEFRNAIAAEIARYGYADAHATTVTSVSLAAGNGFCVTAIDGTQFRAQRLLLATGMVDIYPDVARLEEYWGRSVINCPFCQGFEVQGRAWGILADRPEMLEAAEVYRNWTEDLVLFVPPAVELAEQRALEIEAGGITIVRRSIVGLEGDGEQIREVTLDDGSAFERDVLLIWPYQRQCQIVDSLAPSMTEDGYVVVDDGFRTSLPKVYAAGDVLYGGHQNTNTAIHTGNLAAATMVFDICRPGR